jgi:hypothetical protein
VQHHFAAAGSGDIGGDVGQKRGPADQRAHEMQRDRVLGQIAEHRVPARQVPDPLIGIVGFVIALKFLYPAACAVFLRRAVKRLAHPFQPRRRQGVRNEADTGLIKIPPCLIQIGCCRRQTVFVCARHGCFSLPVLFL